MADYDPLYVGARSVLLDALDALGSQRDAIVVVGAQAVYMQTGDGDIAVAPYTIDADLALAPDDLADDPLLEELMRAADFSLNIQQPGSWHKTVMVGGMNVDIPVDIMVPDGFAPPGGTRSVRIEPHDRMAARKAVGLEGAVLDFDKMEVAALDQADSRAFSVRVAGPAALIVAKMHKINDRLIVGKPDRIANKDAADVYRIIQAFPVKEVVARLRLLFANERSAGPSSAAVGLLGDLFGAPRSQGVVMAAESLREAVPTDRIEAVCVAFTAQVRGDLAL
jgi:hypothetical protein